MQIKTKNVETQSIFEMEGYCIWDPSLVTDSEGKHHLFFSRWPIDKGFEAWVTHSEVCRASAITPLGPFHFEEIVLKKRHGFWDGDVTHNPTIRCFENRYYLYYNGNHGNGEWWNHRNNQRVGLAVADNPEGPWERSEKPLLDVTIGAWDSIVTTNPTCDQTPDGRFILLYKGVGDCNPPPNYGPVLHGVAFSEQPIGPFIKHPDPLFKSAEIEFPGEDPFVWCENGHYYALLKDMGTSYTPSGRAIVLFESDDGKNWHLAQHPIVQERLITHADGRQQKIHRLERPFIYFQKGGTEILFCAIKPESDKHDSQIVAMAFTK